MAWAHAQGGEYGAATGVLAELRDQAPAWLAHQRCARDIVTQMVGARRRAMGRKLAELAALAGC